MFLTTKLDIDGMISQTLLVGNFEAAVDICVEADRMVRGFYGNKSIDIVLVG